MEYYVVLLSTGEYVVDFDIPEGVTDISDDVDDAFHFASRNQAEYLAESIGGFIEVHYVS